MGKTPKTPKAIVDEIHRVLDDIDNETPSMDRHRPHLGKSHTDSGGRGKEKVVGLTMRDIRDCFVRAFIISHPGWDDPNDEDCVNNKPFYDEAIKGERAFLCQSDMFKMKGDVDPVAVAQNLGCEIERMMGIFPNIKKSSFEDTMKELGIDIPKGDS